ncbi:hypothetical protein ES319_D02G025000v1 [Gossypium barbadense]|uniref:Uncharacterized protein n=1 Tax=Gossypium barbadense TaxID=3634 RepID=A0A5J5S7R4_GOSBA|nr:hypothetical protein ES319_D02G025000v1 [Gossypium barbadense]
MKRDEIVRCLGLVMGDEEKGMQVKKNVVKWKGLAERPPWKVVPWISTLKFLWMMLLKVVASKFIFSYNYLHLYFEFLNQEIIFLKTIKFLLTVVIIIIIISN